VSTHEELQRSLGSYVLGALEPAERAEVDAHLPGCRACTQELASYAGLPALLSRVPLEHAVAAPPTPAQSGLPRLLAAVEREQRTRDRRLRRWQTAAGSLAAAAALVVAVTVAPTLMDAEGDRRRLGASQAAVSGTVELESRPWGTSVRLRVTGLPDRGHYTAWAADATGTRTAVASWSGTTSEVVDVTGATSLGLDAVDTITVATGGQDPS
jgi:anti-sigma factor RsiW